MKYQGMQSTIQVYLKSQVIYLLRMKQISDVCENLQSKFVQNVDVMTVNFLAQ